MPVFVLKANDQLALGVVRYYRAMCYLHGLDVQAGQVDLAEQEFEAWRARHPGLVGLPDYRHVPAGGVSS